MRRPHAVVTTAGAVILARCRFCSKFRHPKEFIHDATVGMCWRCYEWHQHALDVLAGGGVPRGCQECGRTYEELERTAGGPDVRMALHPKDGIYQVLCGGCSDEYERKRLDIYGNTPYGHAKKLQGAK